MSKIKKNEPITNIMTKDAEVLQSSSKISEAAHSMLEKGFHHLPVLSGQKLIGMFSYTDLMRLDYSESLNQDRREVFASLDSTKNISDVMSTDLETLKERDSVHDAAKKLCGGKFHSLPVVSEEGNFVGLVTSTDVIRYLAELY